MDNKLWVFAALLIVLVLIGAAAWLVRKFSSGSVGAGANRGRMPRLAVIDAAAVDGRRRLVLVRRDNVEHLIMIGGPTDVVVEPNIVRNAPQREQTPQRGPAGTELPARLSPLPDANWQDEGFDHREPVMPEPPHRTARTPYPDEVRRPSPPIADWSANDLGPSFSEPAVRNDSRASSRSERAEPTPPRMPRATDIPAKPQTPAPRPARQPDPLPSSADQNLADMAQRLEAALRRPGAELRLDGGETRAPAVTAADRVGAPPASSRSAPRAAAPTPKQPGFDNLEDEMASLLGRPKPPA